MSGQMWQRDDNWVGSEIEDSFVMVNIDTGMYVRLNRSTSVIWNAIEHPRSTEQIVTELQARFAVEPEQCRSAVERTLEKMRGLQLAAPH